LNYIESVLQPLLNQAKYYFQSLIDRATDGIELLRVLAAPSADSTSQRVVLHDLTDCSLGVAALDKRVSYADEEALTTVRFEVASFAFIDSPNLHLFFVIRRCDPGDASCGQCRDARRRLQESGATQSATTQVAYSKTGTERVLLTSEGANVTAATATTTPMPTKMSSDSAAGLACVFVKVLLAIRIMW